MILFLCKNIYRLEFILFPKYERSTPFRLEQDLKKSEVNVHKLLCIPKGPPFKLLQIRLKTKYINLDLVEEFQYIGGIYYKNVLT